MIFGGRLATNAPLVYQSFNWAHGVFLAATVGSEKTAASEGKTGEIRRDPFAMLPFCGYNMGDYFSHWLDLGRKLKKMPLIFRVNWFRKDEKGHFIWPGFGENMRVLQWIVNRVKSQAGAVESPLGMMPNYDDLDWNGIDFSQEQFENLMAVDKDQGLNEALLILQYFKQFKNHLPPEFMHEVSLLFLRLVRSDARWTLPSDKKVKAVTKTAKTVKKTKAVKVNKKTKVTKAKPVKKVKTAKKSAGKTKKK